MTAARDDAEQAEVRTLLGPGSSFEGKLVFEMPARVDGKFRGEIRGDTVLVVGPGAELEATLHVGALIALGGRITGDVHALQSIELYVPSSVCGDLRAPEVFIEKGVKFTGSCTMTGIGDLPSPARTEVHAGTTPGHGEG